MFFGYCPNGTFASKYKGTQIQIWETISEFESFFMVKGKYPGGNPISSIVDTYNIYFPESKKEKNDYLALKQGDTTERRQLIIALLNEKITNWTTSVENRSDMELFLFHSKMQSEMLVKHIDTVDKKQESIYAINSFDSSTLKILPIIRDQ